MTTLFYKALILEGEIWCWSLLGHKGLKQLQIAVSETFGFGERIHWFRVDRRPSRFKKYAVSKLSGFMLTGHIKIVFYFSFSQQINVFFTFRFLVLGGSQYASGR